MTILLCKDCAHFYPDKVREDCTSPKNERMSLVTGENYRPFTARDMRQLNVGCGEAGNWFKPIVQEPEAA